MLIKIENDAPVGHPILEDNFRLLFPGEVFPLILTNEIVEPFGFSMYDFSQQPETQWDERLVEGTPERDEFGIYRQKWLIEKLTEEEKQITLNELKVLKNKQIDEDSLAATFAGFTHGDFTFESDKLARSYIDGISSFVSLHGRLPDQWPGAWKTADGYYYPITTAEEWRALVASMVKKGTENYTHSLQLRMQLQAATTYEEITAIQW